ncbi:DUF4232 domain-containing protein [Actinomadura litoris]|uniref:DUF4232 domain-containing protein n=1 Tax=Actinomadura litoris TaxID=2678616 RepID=A0A7K1L1H7_9ACTN|nr:DUF4232 domain-containing protein [Actinomadura litoris]MUN38300.1 DUF4232 domain-containing protein [Actinomadura litoris]
MTRRPRAWPIIAAAVVLCGACGSAPSTDTTAAVPPPSMLPKSALSPSPPPCPPDGISITSDIPDAALGLRAMRIKLANCGTKPYTLNGYPGLTVLDASRKPAPIRIVQGPTEVKDAGPHPLTLTPGKAAEAVVVWRNTVADSVDPPIKGIYLQIVPAPGRQPQTIQPSGTLDLGTTGTLKTTAWTLSR